MKYLTCSEFINNSTEIVNELYEMSDLDVFNRVVKGIDIGNHCKHESDELAIKYEVGNRIRTIFTLN